ncbi:MAG: hypothetical protein DWB43_03705 [Lautropia sp.]|jgi:hypothetical protein|nr:MAG: hypothetical protein EDM78_12545 [Pseudomonadota bacterium]MBC6958628.1 hypothetical protein [Lautropia sp.]MCL4700948.1 hypothetical protein [Burkholderiaceae bacterium]MCZ2413809.1 hypothetical protein [Burkholderiales bacterium]MDL1907075.1 hypothetical protein [Betaproteobacteria bacterium PRO1]
MTQKIPTTSADFDHTRIIERPDGFYWQDDVDGREYGPFQTMFEAAADMQLADDEAADEAGADDLRDAGELLGVPDWVDPDTGQLADDERTRTDEH